jgi:probable rRNA maturation factor
MKKLFYIDIARVFTLILIVVFALLGATQTSEASFSFKEITLKFAQVSDAHISSSKPDTTYKILSNSKDILADVIAQINSIKDLDFVMFTGDMVNDPTLEDYKEFFTLLSTLKYPSLFTLGNHDSAPQGCEGLKKEEVLELFRAVNPNFVFEKSYYAISPKKDFRLISLDLSVDDKRTSNGFLNDEQKQGMLDLLDFAGQHLKVAPNAVMSVMIINNEEIHAINKEYRNIDRATDVISFAAQEGMMDIVFDEEDEELANSFALELQSELGDIYISYERAVEQAQDYNHSVERELGFLELHGLLHLLGYDHMNDEDEREMFDLQKEILEAYGLKRY